MFLNFYDYGYAISIVLFGFWNILTGYLIFRSTFLSRILGVAAGNFGLLLPDQQFFGARQIIGVGGLYAPQKWRHSGIFLYVSDVSRSIRFYQDIFDFSVISDFGERGCAMQAGTHQI